MIINLITKEKCQELRQLEVLLMMVEFKESLPYQEQLVIGSIKIQVSFSKWKRNSQLKNVKVRMLMHLLLSHQNKDHIEILKKPKNTKFLHIQILKRCLLNNKSMIS